MVEADQPVSRVVMEERSKPREATHRLRYTGESGWEWKEERKQSGRRTEVGKSERWKLDSPARGRK